MLLTQTIAVRLLMRRKHRWWAKVKITGRTVELRMIWRSKAVIVMQEETAVVDTVLIEWTDGSRDKHGLGIATRVKSVPGSRGRSPSPRRFACNSPSPWSRPPSTSTHPRTHLAHPHFPPFPFCFEIFTGAHHDLEGDDDSHECQG